MILPDGILWGGGGTLGMVEMSTWKIPTCANEIKLPPQRQNFEGGGVCWEALNPPVHAAHNCD